MHHRKKIYVPPSLLAALMFVLALFSPRSFAGPAATTRSKDVLIFKDGEKLIGTLERADGDSLQFKSDMAGELKVDWANVAEFHSEKTFAVAPKNVSFGRRENPDVIPQGTLNIANQKVTLSPPPSAAKNPMALEQADHIIGEDTFRNAIKGPGLFSGWKGSTSFGSSLVVATQSNRNFASSVSLSRSLPTESWMNPENRTILNFSLAYGELKQPGQPNVKTSIYHADGEQDQYFTNRLYAFGQAAFDHNFSLGLNLQQAYDGGLGWTIVNERREQFDLRASLGYLNQQFEQPSQDKMLVGSLFSETYNRTFEKRIELHEQLAITAAWNDLRATSATANVTLTLPVSKRLAITLGSLDTFLNDPSPGFKKNSFQFTTSLSFLLP